MKLNKLRNISLNLAVDLYSECGNISPDAVFEYADFIHNYMYGKREDPDYYTGFESRLEAVKNVIALFKKRNDKLNQDLQMSFADRFQEYLCKP